MSFLTKVSKNKLTKDYFIFKFSFVASEFCVCGVFVSRVHVCACMRLWRLRCLPPLNSLTYFSETGLSLNLKPTGSDRLAGLQQAA